MLGRLQRIFTRFSCANIVSRGSRNISKVLWTSKKFQSHFLPQYRDQKHSQSLQSLFDFKKISIRHYRDQWHSQHLQSLLNFQKFSIAFLAPISWVAGFAISPKLGRLQGSLNRFSHANSHWLANGVLRCIDSSPGMTGSHIHLYGGAAHFMWREHKSSKLSFSWEKKSLRPSTLCIHHWQHCNGTYSQSFAQSRLRAEQIGALFNSHSVCVVVVDVESLEDLCRKKIGQSCFAIALGSSLGALQKRINSTLTWYPQERRVFEETFTDRLWRLIRYVDWTV